LFKLSDIEEMFTTSRFDEYYDQFENMLIKEGEILVKEFQFMLVKHL
jgi:hypothetical protein